MPAEGPLDPDKSSPFKYRIGENESTVEAVLAAVETVADETIPPFANEVITADGGDSYSPLYNVVDPDALASLIQSMNRNDTNGQVSFSYCGCTVTVHNDETIQVTQKTRNPDIKGDKWVACA